MVDRLGAGRHGLGQAAAADGQEQPFAASAVGTEPGQIRQGDGPWGRPFGPQQPQQGLLQAGQVLARAALMRVAKGWVASITQT